VRSAIIAAIIERHANTEEFVGVGQVCKIVQVGFQVTLIGRDTVTQAGMVVLAAVATNASYSSNVNRCFICIRVFSSEQQCTQIGVLASEG